MTAEPVIGSHRLLFHSLLTASRTTLLAALVCCGLQAHNWHELTWQNIVYTLADHWWLPAAVFAFCLVWDFARHVMAPPRSG